jgi:predicted Rossmann fold nucleotide-binding protein DprA/Smf involved in DNA uptake
LRYSFTGPARADGTWGTRKIRAALMELPLEHNMEFTTGGAFGVDTIAYFEAIGMYPDAKHRVCVPDGEPYNSVISGHALEYDHEVIYVPGGYMKRNDELVAQCDVLLAFPRSAEEELRSGTWATIRRARKAGKEVRLFPLLG